MQSKLLLLAWLASTALANPIERGVDDNFLECRAITKTFSQNDNQVKRDTSSHCGVTGYLKKRDAEGPSRNHISLDRCADYCVCDLGKDSCQSFEWKEDPRIKGFGHCQVHTVSLSKHNHRSVPVKRDERAAPVFYNNECFHEVRRAKRAMSVPLPRPTGTIIPPPLSSSSIHPSTPTQGPEDPGIIPPIIIPPPQIKADSDSPAESAGTQKRSAAPMITAAPSVHPVKREAKPKTDNLVVAALLGV